MLGAYRNASFWARLSFKHEQKIILFPRAFVRSRVSSGPSQLCKKLPMTASDIATGATAQLQVAKEKRGSSQLEVKTNSLAKPGRLQPLNIAYRD
jgi:hypothetical protein